MPDLLIDHLVKQFPAAKRQTLKRMVAAGRVTINGEVAKKLKQPLSAGDIVRVAERVEATPEPVVEESLPDIVFEDEDLLVVNKPPGLLTSTIPHEPRATLLAKVRRYVEKRDPKARLGLIHRLDREAAGLLVFSKNDLAYQSLKEQFFRHSVDRIYAAVVQGVPRPRKGRIESHLVEKANGSVHSTLIKGEGEHALTEYEVVQEDGRQALLRVRLHTGRKHQIRSHLSERRWPIVGDPRYGPKLRRNGRLMLMATELSLTHPRTGQRMSFKLPLPRAFRAAGRRTKEL